MSGLADLVSAAGGTVVPTVVADEHPAVAVLEECILKLQRGQGRAAVDVLTDAMALLEEAMDVIVDNDDLMAEF